MDIHRVVVGDNGGYGLWGSFIQDMLGIIVGIVGRV